MSLLCFCGCRREIPEQDGRGRPAQFYSNACRQKVYRKRQKNGEFRNAAPLRNKLELDLFFCAGGNEGFMEEARRWGYMIGIRSNYSAYNFDIQFVDIDYHKPNFEKHLKVIGRHKPKYATVLDLSDKEVFEEDIERALKQYEQVKAVSSKNGIPQTIPLIVPKLPGQIAQLPAEVAIGYSVLTSYGGAQYELYELEGRRVHLLGGNPADQMETYEKLQGYVQPGSGKVIGRADVMSADGNMAMNVARNFAQYWDRGWVDHPEKGKTKPGEPKPPLYRDCWRWSCRNIRREWEELVTLTTDIPPMQPALFDLNEVTA